MTTQTKTPKFEYLQDVVNSLRYSQGFYSRLANQLETLSQEEIEEIGAQLPDFQDRLDVIFFLEQ